MKSSVQEPTPRRPEITVDVVRSTESLDFNDWARRLVGYAIALDRENQSTKTQPSTAA